MVYLRAEDLIIAPIGPFGTREAVLAHSRLCAERGDAAAMRVVTEDEAEKIRRNDRPLMLKAEDDRSERQHGY